MRGWGPQNRAHKVASTESYKRHSSVQQFFWAKKCSPDLIVSAGTEAALPGSFSCRPKRVRGGRTGRAPRPQLDQRPRAEPSWPGRARAIAALGTARAPSKAGVVSPTPGRTIPTQGSARPPPRPMLPAVRPATAPVSSVSSKDLPRYRPTSRDGFRGAGRMAVAAGAAPRRIVCRLFGPVRCFLPCGTHDGLRPFFSCRVFGKVERRPVSGV